MLKEVGACGSRIEGSMVLALGFSVKRFRAM